MRDWRKKSSRIRVAFKETILLAARILGRFEPYRASDIRTKRTSPVPFFGERPSGTRFGALVEHRVAFETDRPYCEHVSNLLYSPAGIAWVDGKIIEKYCIRRPSVGEILERPPRHIEVHIDAATIVESDFPYSYGDWLHCYLGSILTSGDRVIGPVVIPATLHKKSYVQRDLAIAQIEHLPADTWVSIENAVALRKRNFGFIWDQEYCASFMSKFAPVRPEPTPGSLVYFARRQAQGEAVTRTFPTDLVAGVVEMLGGTVIDQEAFSPEFSKQVASSCDIVIMDHGSGGTNIMYWKPSLVVELYVDRWWNHNTLFVSDALQDGKHAVLDVEALSAGKLREKLETVFIWAGVHPKNPGE